MGCGYGGHPWDGQLRVRYTLSLGPCSAYIRLVEEWWVGAQSAKAPQRGEMSRHNKTSQCTGEWQFQQSCSPPSFQPHRYTYTSYRSCMIPSPSHVRNYSLLISSTWPTSALSMLARSAESATARDPPKASSISSNVLPFVSGMKKYSYKAPTVVCRSAQVRLSCLSRPWRVIGSENDRLGHRSMKNGFT